MARITNISIEGLFGVFDYEIPLNQDDRITILTGPNGFGKTTVLRLIFYIIDDLKGILDQVIILNDDFIKFDRVTLLLDTNIQLDLCQEPRISGQIPKWEDVKITIKDPTLESVYKYSITRSGPMRHGNPLILKSRSGAPENFLYQVLQNLDIHFITTERLMTSTFDGKISAIQMCAGNLGQLVKSKSVKYAEVSQRLDKTYPFRVIDKGNDDQSHIANFLQELQYLQDLNSRLTSVRILDDTENFEGESLKVALATDPLDMGTQNMLNVYIRDSKEKYAVFTDLLQKMELFQEILNRKLAYSHKHITFSREEGFLVSYKQTKNSHYPQDEIPLTALSSGEQHQIVLLYELLFELKPGSLVLIDEPEISLHLSWQVEFLEDLQEISRLNDLDFLIATHAPSIIEDRWDLVVELKG